MSVFGFLRRPYVEMSDTNELLWAYVREGSEQAFNEIVLRHVDFIYSTALRKLAGDTHLAQDVTQTVFADLARKAGSLPKDVVLIGWLHRDACFRAADAVRSERRRRAREQKALEMETLSETAGDRWVHLAPFLDDALEKLSSLERDALLLRFVEGKTWRQTGEALALSEDAVQKRAGRALEKLRAQFARRGIAISTAVMATALAANSVQAAPIGLAASLAGTALAGAGTASVTTSLAETLLMTTKTKIAIVAAAGIAAVTAPIVWQHQANTRLREDLATLRQEHGRLSAAAEQKLASTSVGNSATNSILNWRALESRDYAQYIANLRAVGCPEQTIRDIVITDLDRAYGQRIAKISPQDFNVYWKPGNYLERINNYLAVRKVEEEKRAVIRQLLGVDADEEAERRTGVAIQYGQGFEFLSADLRARLREIERHAEMKLQSVELIPGGWTDPDYQRKKNEALVWKENAIKELLSPGQFEEYEMRVSHDAFRLRNSLRPFNPSEEEFRTLFRLEKQFGMDQANSGGNPADSARKQIDEQTGRVIPSATSARQFQEAVKQALGEQRYADYELATDSNYSMLHNIVQTHGLPQETARAVYDMNKAAEQQATAIRENSTLSPEAREAAFERLRKQTEEEASKLLGDAAFPLYRHQFGAWLYHKLSK
jgi:RNA polymerase sigma factor (sigma-70 family)